MGASNRTLTEWIERLQLEGSWLAQNIQVTSFGASTKSTCACETGGLSCNLSLSLWENIVGLKVQRAERRLIMNQHKLSTYLESD